MFRLPAVLFCASLTSCGEGDLAAEDCGDLDPTLADVCWTVSLSERFDEAAITARCAKISSEWHQGACRIQGAHLLARGGGDVAARLTAGHRLCAPITSAVWREECDFQLLDQLSAELSPLSWVQECSEHLDTFRSACLNHGVSRWLEGTLDAAQPAWFDLAALEEQFDQIQRAGGGNPRADALYRELLRASDGDWLARCGRRLDPGFCAGDVELDGLRPRPEAMGAEVGLEQSRLLRERLASVELRWRSQETPRWW